MDSPPHKTIPRINVEPKKKKVYAVISTAEKIRIRKKLDFEKLTAKNNEEQQQHGFSTPHTA